ncbi:protein DPCD [Anabrus simplex]|uniref:protein DPCD n=1 Tax=Anabrus simplex TaxID=316456 RepID=UPI0034DD1CA5
MIIQNWLERIQKAQKIGIIQDGKRKIHYTFGDGLEMVEEYNMETDVLVKRAWRNRTKLKGDGAQWDVEIGDPEASLVSLESIGIKESSSAPFVTRRITKSALEWRIRNLPYPLNTYAVTAEPEKKCITVRTSNKKYYKTLSVPDLERVGLLPEQNRIQYSHKYNTLIITYQKPPEVVQLEKKILEEVKKVKTTKEGDPDCKPS